MNIEQIHTYFKVIRDDRQSAKIDYPLFDLLFGTLCAVIAGLGVGQTFESTSWRITMGLFSINYSRTVFPLMILLLV